jgi:hypothetical protein
MRDVSLPAMRGSRRCVLDQLRMAIKDAARRGIRLSVTDEARRLFDDPACQMSLDQIKEEILCLAVSERMPMELDSVRRASSRHDESGIRKQVA